MLRLYHIIGRPSCSNIHALVNQCTILPLFRCFVSTLCRADSARYFAFVQFEGAQTLWKSADRSVILAFSPVILSRQIAAKWMVVNQFNQLPLFVVFVSTLYRINSATNRQIDHVGVPCAQQQPADRSIILTFYTI